MDKLTEGVCQLILAGLFGLVDGTGFAHFRISEVALKGPAPVAKASTKKSAAKKKAKPVKKVKRPVPAAKKKAAPVVVKKKAAKVVAPVKKVVVAKAVKSAPPVMGKGKVVAAKGMLRPANGVKLEKVQPAHNPYAQSGEVVLSNGKPKKNQAGLNMRELEHFRDLLLAKRRELVGDMSSMEREALRSTSGSNLSNLPIHMADMGTDNYEQEFTLGLVQKDRDILREINLALAKIQNGMFGICEGTGKPIGKPRLEAKPWARHGIEFARKLESHGVR